MPARWPHDGSFLVGANLPWISYGNDFGANAWHPAGGLARPEETAQARETLRALADCGARSVRWFALCDGRAGLNVDDRGRLHGPDARLFADFDAAVSLLDEVGLRGVFVLFDFPWFRRPRIVNGVQAGGRTRMVAAPGPRAALLETVVAPVLDRYGQEPAILAWEVINEPDWAITRVPWLRRSRVSAPVMRDFIFDVASLVHQRTAHMVTVGCASARSLPLVAGLGLDFYQVHWYDNILVRFDLRTEVSAFGLDRPVLLGEFPTRGSRRPPGEILSRARTSGYAGAFPWSLVAGDRASDAEALTAALHTEKGHLA